MSEVQEVALAMLPEWEEVVRAGVANTEASARVFVRSKFPDGGSMTTVDQVAWYLVAWAA